MEPQTDVQVTIKTVDDEFVASIRFLGQHADIPGALARLQEKAGPWISGDPICLYHRADDERPTEVRDLEVCYPVSQPVSDGEVRSWVLEGGEMLSASYPAPVDLSWGPAPWWQGLISYLRQHQVAPDEDALREIHHGSGAGGTAELQMVMLWPRWQANLAAGLDRYADGVTREQVMAGSEAARPDAPIAERLAWTQHMLDRLDAAVMDPQARACILNGCAHRFPPARIAKMRAEYERLGDIDALIAVMRADRSVGGTSWYGDPVRQGNVIFEVKAPADPEGYAQAQDEVEKRVCRCFCLVAQEAIRSGAALSPTFCHCGAGWYVQLWEGVLQQPVRVEILETVLHGGEACRFAIHLPEGVVRE